ncbi:hypothetical protein [Marinomonas mediterranea]|jgi:hypothetical protein|uniref:Tetratricopeptide repeat protein n=1 Tax=Marinomonas mediterranea (strain ATCC 700492 / JCM 21426 / NBRC 103028 / MMB-1) TaxID=717774 RepID=F2JXQ7_MARM1|nr:hypothetical protein [Marinomonas mediterranea]ADZ93055.1 hypothetical protein Marme_3845 [Marinomonas mediterranea MMB-1]WCN10962.1 hypothetical protein GV055_19515 [Marinomonas mediterranea]WCN15024.1 hypothetical protein GV054_19420 [Marinomonas mediterranea]WCN19068.1 hypothetical protein GV053_19480 [Marinomonas mediterranea MMB-1]
MKYLLLFFIIFSVGCATGPIPETSNPKKKIENAYRLRDRGEPLKAEALIGEALAIFKTRESRSGIAGAYIAYGDLYKSKSYQGTADAPENVQKLKTYQDSANYYQKASDVYYEYGDTFMASWALMGMGDAYYSADNLELACESYDKAEVISQEVSKNKRELESGIRRFRNHVNCNE